jgi:hypothetical protein
LASFSMFAQIIQLNGGWAEVIGRSHIAKIQDGGQDSRKYIRFSNLRLIYCPQTQTFNDCTQVHDVARSNAA